MPEPLTWEQWAEKVIAEKDARKQRREQKANTVINLTNPKAGDMFSFLPDEHWIIEFVILLVGKPVINRALLFLKKTRGTSLYCVPQRINGNLERSTLRSIPEDYLGTLQNINQIDPDIPPEPQMIAHMAGFPELIRPSWVSDVESWEFDRIGETREPVDGLFEQFKWSVRVQGLKPFPWQWVDTDDNGQKHTVGFEMGIRYEPFEAFPEPDTTLLDHIPPKARIIKINPDNLHATANTLKKYFDVDELIDVLKQ